ncbi:MAG: DUF4445 domain-containing protein [Actinobacteria bacterium]|nr:DUF4445 domain-containing protein [Actinomycetota bacterium]
MTSKTYTVLFTPEQVEVQVESGTTILAAAAQAGVFINSLCGGDGVCGKCRVIVRLGEAQGGTTNHLTRVEIQQGYILACEGRVMSDLVVEVPPESQLTSDMLAEEHPAEQFAETFLMRTHVPKLDPLVRKVYLELPAPTLENNLADLERLEHALSKSLGTQEFQMGLKITQRLATLLRSSDWKVTATAAYRGSLTEITEVECGNTSRCNLGVAVDVGTTTVMAQLIDLTTGGTMGIASRYNSQIRYGGDIIRRIMHASQEEGGLSTLQQAITGDINSLIQKLQQKFRLGCADITTVTAAGNTTMMHCLLGILPDYIRKEPYVGAAYCPPPFRAAEVGIKINARGLVYCLPCVSSFVGADITAGVMAVEMHKSDKLTMFVDIGTNGEIVIGHKEFLVAASASAGPAFEGTDSHDGMRASAGAIDHLQIYNKDRLLSFSTIGGKPPVGICGTGYIDLLAELLKNGLMDKRGKLNTTCGSKRIRSGEHGQPEYVVIRARDSGRGKDVVITQADIANMLRAKGAIYSAGQVLLQSLGYTFDDVERVLVAGGFGTSLNVESAVTIGLLPDLPRQRIQFVGNASISGAGLAAVSRRKYDEAREIAQSMTYFELSTDPTFMGELVSACFFPHTDIQRFPSVMEALADGRLSKEG